TLTKLAVAAALASLAMGAQAITYEPGTYTVKVNGHNAAFEVAVTVSKDKIEKIEFPNNLETIGVGKVALDKLSKEIIEKQSLGVDNVTGATISSFALKSALKLALAEAKVSTEDMQTLQKNVEQYTALPNEIETQVVVVGSGGAGQSAAIAAQQAGSKVIVLEKLGYLGGSTNVSEGAFNAADPERQSKQGIEDSVQKHYEQTMKGGHNVAKPEMVHYLSEHGLETIHWMERLGVEFKDEVGTATGALFQRSHYPKKPSGHSYIEVYEKYIKDHADDITVYTDMTAEVLIKNPDGKVIGVIAKDNHTGKETTFYATRGVVLATGGFGANVKLRQEVNTGVFKEQNLGPNIGTTNINKAAQGEGIEMGKKAGANVIGMSDIQIHPCGTPGTGLMEGVRTSGRNRIFVNKEGNRFVNEGAARDVLAKAIFAQPDSKYYVIVNHLRYPSLDYVDENGAKMKDMLEIGKVVAAGTLEELAKKLNVPVENLKKAVDTYNSVVGGTGTDVLGFVADNKADKKMTEGPWYAAEKVPTVHHTMGGLEINTKAQVLGTDGKVIPGLYAAGETTGGIHGSNRLGGNAIADIMTFGRDAGTNVAHETPTPVKMAAESKESATHETPAPAKAIPEPKEPTKTINEAPATMKVANESKESVRASHGTEAPAKPAK
ncbi:MAG: flavocytochrome c, partial [Burkholderiales bacterium]|nr:flavocytochrome c [Burkholderiales bacterium]